MKVILFDCFAVLCSPPYSPAIKQLVGDTAEQRRLIDMLTETDLGNIAEQQMTEEIAKSAGITSSLVAETANANMKLDIEMIKLAQSLRSTHKIALLTNAPKSIVDRAFEGDMSLFDFVFISSELKMIKPNRDIFEYAISEMNVAAKDVLFVDDREENTVAAERLGMLGHVFTDVASFQSHLDKIL